MPRQETSDAAGRTSLWNLGGLTVSQLGRNVLGEIRVNNLVGRASELAFEFLFALFPLILLMLTAFGLFTSQRIELQAAFLSYFGDFLPSSAYQLLAKTPAELVTHASGGKLAFGIVAALWVASGGVGSIISALNSAYHVPETRSWFKVRAISIGLTLLIATLLVSALFIVLVTGDVIDWIGKELHLQSSTVFVWKAAQWPTAVLFVIFSYSIIYHWGPDLKDRCWHWVTPGSAFGASLWLLASVAFRTYLRFFNTYSASYGSLGAVMILLVWLYVTGFAFLLGGQINAEIQRASPKACA